MICIGLMLPVEYSLGDLKQTFLFCHYRKLKETIQMVQKSMNWDTRQCPFLMRQHPSVEEQVKGHRCPHWASRLSVSFILFSATLKLKSFLESFVCFFATAWLTHTIMPDFKATILRTFPGFLSAFPIKAHKSLKNITFFVYYQIEYVFRSLWCSHYS